MTEPLTPVPYVLRKLATVRSGDKGNHVNLGVVAFNEDAYQFLASYLTEDLVYQYFRGSGVTEVRRYALPNVWSLNFVLYNALAGGASRSLRIDTQGKLFGTALLELRLPYDVDHARVLFE